MATLSDKDGIVNLNSTPESQRANLTQTETANGTVYTNAGVVSNASFFINGDARIRGGLFVDPTITFSSGPNGTDKPRVGFQNTTVRNAGFVGSSTDDQLTAGGNNAGAKARTTTSIINASARFGTGADSVSFARGARTTGSSYNLGSGQDSVTFGNGSFAKKTSVDLGRNDGASDIVDVANQGVVKKLKVNDFGINDTLRVGSKTYDYSDLQARDGKVGNIKVSFDRIHFALSRPPGPTRTLGLKPSHLSTTTLAGKVCGWSSHRLLTVSAQRRP